MSRAGPGGLERVVSDLDVIDRRRPPGCGLLPGPDEQSVALTRDYRLIQKRRGHRYSVDDMLVAHLAVTRSRSAQRVLDLGCGLGSVLLTTAWAFPAASLVGLEVLPQHVAFAERNIRLNGCQDRARVVEGDLRDASLVESLGAFDLVTGSPPYFGLRSGTPCADSARTAAHFEVRGGIEDYAVAASRALGPRGLFVTCAGADPPQRAHDALRQAGLSLLYHQAVVPRVGKAPFLRLLIAAKAITAALEEAPRLVLRDENGRLTAEHVAIRESTGLRAKD
jgi:tRNA1Val (adenine37-N6)-methyltransferase